MKMYFDTKDYFHTNIIEELKDSIEKYHGQEFFVGGLVDEEKKIYSVDILSRGNETAVPVVYEEAKKYHVVIHNHPSGVIRPSDADLQVASILGDYGLGFYIVDNEYSQVNVVVPIPKKEIKKELVAQKVLSFFKDPVDSNKIKKGNETLEDRPSQKKMIEGVIKAFNKDQIYVCEAPTGTGKTMAYLIPTFHWIKENKEKVVISTNTINLQEQLIQKDIPLVMGKLGENISYALVKGRGNYLCRRKFSRFKSDWNQKLPELMELEHQLDRVDEIVEWGSKTTTGDKSELSFVPSSLLWDQIASESDTCRRSKCPALDHCFYNRARKKIFSADLLIINHHILCADAAIKKESGKYNSQGLLPAFERLIIDEAHNLDEVGTSYFGQSASRFSIDRNLGLIGRLNKKKNGLTGGVLFNLYEKLLQEKGNEDSLVMDLRKTMDKFITSLQTFQSKMNNIFKELYIYLEKISDSNFQEKKVRFKSKHLKDLEWEKGFKNPLSSLIAELSIIKRLIDTIEIQFESKELKNELEQYVHELSAYKKRIDEILEICHLSLDLDRDEEIHWITGIKRKEGKINFSTHISPLYVAKEFSEVIFNSLSTVVLTSATLRDSQGFDFLSQSIGLNHVPSHRIKYETLPVNFDYKKNCTFIIPSIFPLPHQPQFTKEVSSFIEKAVDVHKGKTMVLFTSYSQLLAAMDIIREKLELKGYTVLVQGEAPRHLLIDRFKVGTGQVLCGVNSLWEGIDIKGEALSCVVMVKIPFIVPTDPIHEARIEYLEEKGKNSFVEYMIPNAVIRFKQGFGRLIRGSEDKGDFVVLDRRLLVKSYGQAFLNSLPETKKRNNL